MDALVEAPAEVSKRDEVQCVESSLREAILDHLFMGDLLRSLWLKGIRDIEVLRAEVDRGGYDLVLECNGVTRYVQLKSSHRGATTREVKVGLKLGRKASGCVIWIWFDRETLELGPFRWLGDAPGKKLPPLGDKIARHSKGNSKGKKNERPNLRVVAKSRFEVLDTMDRLVERLFGPLPVTAHRSHQS